MNDCYGLSYVVKQDLYVLSRINFRLKVIFHSLPILNNDSSPNVIPDCPHNSHAEKVYSQNFAFGES
jgi:hypothetical protein